SNARRRSRVGRRRRRPRRIRPLKLWSLISRSMPILLGLEARKKHGAEICARRLSSFDLATNSSRLFLTTMQVLVNRRRVLQVIAKNRIDVWKRQGIVGVDDSFRTGTILEFMDDE